MNEQEIMTEVERDAGLNEERGEHDRPSSVTWKEPSKRLVVWLGGRTTRLRVTLKPRTLTTMEEEGA